MLLHFRSFNETILVNYSDGRFLSHSEVQVSTGKTPALPPTITVTDADQDPHPTGVPPESLPPSNKAVPGALPDGPAPQIPDWYKVGWRAVGGIDEPITEGEERDKAILEQFLSEQFYGAWWHNAAVIFFVRNSLANFITEKTNKSEYFLKTLGCRCVAFPHIIPFWMVRSFPCTCSMCYILFNIHGSRAQTCTR